MDLEKIKSLRKNLVLVAMVELICGLFMIIMNDRGINILIQLFGIIAVAYGIITFLTWLFKKDKSNSAGTIILLVVCLVAGACLIFLTDHIVGIFTLVTGVTLIVYGIIKVPNIFRLRKGGFKKWAIGLIPVLLIIAAGAVIIWLNSGEKSSLIAILLGVGLILGCACDIITMAAASSIEHELQEGEEIDAEQEKIEEKK